MANRNRKSSPSDLSERTPVAPAPTAGVSGASGHALAAIVIANAEAVGELAEKQAMSRKDTLAKLIGLDPDNRKEFYADMVAAQKRINDDATAVKNRSLRDYMEDYPKAGSVYAEASMWIGVSKAVDLGWKPMSDKGEALEQADWPEWRLITMQATKARDAKGKPSADGKNPELAASGKKKGKRGRPTVTPTQKAVTAVRAALKDDTGKDLPKNNRNLAEVVRGILSDATVEELAEVAAVVSSMIEASHKAAEQAKKATEDAMAKAAAHAEQEQKTSQGATVKRVKHGKEVPTGAINTETPADNLVKRGKEMTKA